ncbi:MAG: PQQ-dependent sugar dehydrogenase [Proteobacteria bacterium]|nr:PQQ-dependent sugar dehydrogenase [Pseudomonadota bacterium]
MRWIRRLLVGVVLLALGVAALAAGACRFVLPERFAINAPMAHQMFGLGGVDASDDLLGQQIELAEGFGIGLFAEGLRIPRFLRFTSEGDLLVTTTRSGRVVLLFRDADGDGRSDGRRTLLEGLDRPQGMDFLDGFLYVAESGAVGRVRFDPVARTTLGDYERIVEDIPAGGNHYTRTLRFGPDGWMYVSIGSSCNVCEQDDPRRAAIVRYRPDGSGEEIFATGLRNSVGFDWRPGTGELYATDNGRDLLGNDFPPCELNLVVQGGFYGWPYANGDRELDPDLGAGHEEEVRASLPPAHPFRAHNAPLGITFLRGDGVPAAYRGAALVALHGSWNRTKKDGYSVVSLHWRGDEIEERAFATGFERDGDVIGRPVDVAEGPDGAIYVSDDYAGAIYRIAHGEASRSAPASAKTRRREHPLGAIPPAERLAAAKRGRFLYTEHDCASCHDAGRAAPGVLPVPLSDLSARYDVGELASFLAAPTPPMPAFPLSEQERRDLAVDLLERHP